MMTLVTTAPVASSTFDTSRVHSLTRPNMVSVGTIIWLSSELMFFAGLFAMYFTARARSLEGWPPEPTHLDLPYATVFTLILFGPRSLARYRVIDSSAAFATPIQS